MDNQDHCPPALQALRGLTQTHCLATGLTSALIKTSIPQLYCCCCCSLSTWAWELISQSDSFHPCFTWAHSLRQLLSGYWRQTYSKLLTFQAGHLLLSLWRCLKQVPHDSLLWTPAKVFQTSATDTASSSRNITDDSITDQRAPSSEPAPPALRMSQGNDPLELRRLWHAAVAQQGWVQQAGSQLSDYRLK